MDKRIALTGGIACGKSLAAKFLNAAGVETIDADDVVHELLPDAAERRRLATEVFADPAKRKALEARIHPLVKERIDAFLAERRAAGRLALAIVPLLFETHWNEDYDIICAVVSKKETQISRMMTTRGYSREEALSRLAAQLPVTEKAEKSHYVIHNDSTPEALEVEIKKFISWLKN